MWVKNFAKHDRPKYDHRLKNKKYTTPLPYSWGCGVVERHLEMGKPTKKDAAIQASDTRGSSHRQVT